MSEAENRRIHQRKPIELRVEYKRLNTFFADYTRNISKGGSFIKTRNPLGLGTQFVFKLHVPTLEQPIALTGRVKWIVGEDTADPNEEPGMGIEFIYDDPTVRERLHELVESMLRDELGPHVATQLQVSPPFPTGSADKE
jgi:type IV pilus assembly protein PilZ